MNFARVAKNLPTPMTPALTPHNFAYIDELSQCSEIFATAYHSCTCNKVCLLQTLLIELRNFAYIANFCPWYDEL